MAVSAFLRVILMQSLSTSVFCSEKVWMYPFYCMQFYNASVQAGDHQQMVLVIDFLLHGCSHLFRLKSKTGKAANDTDSISRHFFFIHGIAISILLMMTV